MGWGILIYTIEEEKLYHEHNIDTLSNDIHDAVCDIHGTVRMIFHVNLRDGNNLKRM